MYLASAGPHFAAFRKVSGVCLEDLNLKIKKLKYKDLERKIKKAKKLNSLKAA